MQPVVHFWGILGTYLQTPTNRILRSGRWSMGIPVEPELDQKMPVMNKWKFRFEISIWFVDNGESTRESGQKKKIQQVC